jgi:hypothetical protein
MRPSRSRARRSLPVALAAGLVALVVGLAAGGPAVDAAGQSARERRAEVRAQQAAVAAQVDALQGDQAQVDAALATLDENVRGQQATLADARRKVEASAAEVARAEASIAVATAEIDALKAQVVAYAVDAYVNPPDEDLMRRFEADTAQEDATRQALLEMQAGEDSDVIDQMAAARQRLDDERRAAESARDAAEAAATAADEALVSLGEAQAQQQAFAEQVRVRLDQRLADAAHLSVVDAELGRTIAAEQAALAAAVAKLAPPPSRSTTASGGSGSSGGGGGGSSGSGGSSSGGGGSTTRPIPSVARPPLATVGGITVNAAIADQLRGLLDAAMADGVFLGGYGYRDVSNQIALRRQNCGSSDHAVWDMAPDQCSPPTARPGTSMHERGLAIDFSVNGRFINSRSDAAFLWLAANAGRFGFANLPSEPWHWSNDGT